ncbi:MAG: DnaA/Hda family protein [Alphaproteobacteria bacterium]|nr:DnaA/Hda family protein [Alphaproteobacteria bacterium]
MINNNKKNVQLSLNLKKKGIYEKDDFLVSSSNKEAYKLVNSWPEWRSRKIIIFGDSGTGKTHLSKIWQKNTSAIILNLNQLKKIKFESFFKKKNIFIIENISDFFDKINNKEKNNLEKQLLHFYNLIEEKKGYLLLTSLIAPKLWKISLPDLKSRILSSIAVKIKKPNDQLLSSVLVKLFVDKQILIDKKIIKFIVYRSERSFANLENIVNKIDKQSLITKKKININFVKKLI